MSDLTKEQKKELRRKEWQEQLEKEAKSQKWKKVFTWIALPVVLIGGFWLLTVITTPAQNTSSQSLSIPAVNDKDITLGPKNAKAKLVEYADFQCPACKNFHIILKQLEKDYDGKVLFVYRFFPLTQIHKNSHTSAQAAYAAYLQGKFWEMNDLLFDNQDKWAELDDPKDIFISYATQLGLDVDKFKSDMNSDSTKKAVNESENKAISENLDHTPTIFLNGKELKTVGTYEEVKLQIDNELSKK